MSANRRLRCFGFAAALLLACAPVRADFPKLVGTLPGSANVVVLVSVDKLSKSAMVTGLKWSGQAKTAGDTPPLIPPGTNRLAMAGLLDTGRLNSVWEISALELAVPLSAQTILGAQGGFVDTVGGRQAVCSPANAYFIPMDGGLLGIVSPANRQFAARWTRQTAGGGLTGYLADAAKLAEAADVVMAIDLADAASAPGFERRAKSGDFKSLDDPKLDVAAAAKVVAGIKGVTLTINVTDKAAGMARIDFSSDAGALGAVGKAMVLEMLEKGGMNLPDVEKWTFAVEGSAITASGDLSADGLRRLLSVLAPPSANASSTATASAGDGAAVDPAASAASASQAYYRAVAAILDHMPQASALSSSAAWLTRDARRIEQLPIVNVDQDLIIWGGSVAAGYNNASQILADGQAKANARVSGITSGGGMYNMNGDQSAARADAESARAQRRQAAQEERQRASQDAYKVLTETSATRTTVRASMVAKYKVEF